MDSKFPLEELSLDDFEEDKTPVVRSVVVRPPNRDELLDRLREREAYKKARVGVG